MLKYLPVAAFTLTSTTIVKNHYSNIENKNQIDTLQNSINENIELNKELRRSIESIKEDRESILNNLNDALKGVKENQNTITETLDQISETNANNAECISTSQKLITELSDKYNTILEIIKKSGGNEGNNFLDYNIIESLNNYISSLTPIEILSFMHICGSIVILFSLFSILTIFYGEFFIQKFTLETRYPKLAKFIQLRRKFQQFYLLTQILTILAILIVSTFVDLLHFPSLFN